MATNQPKPTASKFPRPLTFEADGTDCDALLPRLPKPTGEWTISPVLKKDGSVWEGLAYIDLPDGRGLGAVNAEQAKAICREHNALAQEAAESWAIHDNKPTGEWTVDELAKIGVPEEWRQPLCDMQSASLEQQLAAGRKAHCKDCCCARSWEALGVTDYTGKSIPEHIQQLREQLAAEEKRCIEANADTLRSYIDQIATEREKVQTLVDALKEIHEAGYTLTRQDGTNVIDAALAKYPLPDGRTH